MFIITAKLPRRKLALGAAIGVFLCCTALIIFSISPPAVRQASGSAQAKVRNNQERVEFLERYGWQVSPEPISTEEFVIPKELDESYQEYLTLQSSQGFDVAQYAGKRVKRYTYEITNYPTGETGILANLLIYKKTVIGGEVLSPQLDGFLHGLAMP